MKYKKKTLQKNKTSRQIHTQTQKLNQQANQCKIDCARHISKQATKCKMKQSKKNASLIS